jgi:hypothetical protein
MEIQRICRYDEGLRKVRSLTLAVPVIVLGGGALTAAKFGAEAGLFAAAVVLGWTQLVGT